MRAGPRSRSGGVSGVWAVVIAVVVVAAVSLLFVYGFSHTTDPNQYTFEVYKQPDEEVLCTLRDEIVRVLIRCEKREAFR